MWVFYNHIFRESHSEAHVIGSDQFTNSKHEQNPKRLARELRWQPLDQ